MNDAPGFGSGLVHAPASGACKRALKRSKRALKRSKRALKRSKRALKRRIT